MPKLLRIVCAIPIGLALGHAQCPVNAVVVHGHIVNPVHRPTVHVQLVYPKDQAGESASIAPESDTFRLPIEFLTQSNRPLIKNLHPKCDRKPQSVVVTLREGDQERDGAVLKFPTDFDHTDPSAYSVRSEVVLKNPR